MLTGKGRQGVPGCRGIAETIEAGKAPMRARPGGLFGRESEGRDASNNKKYCISSQENTTRAKEANAHDVADLIDGCVRRQRPPPFPRLQTWRKSLASWRCDEDPAKQSGNQIAGFSDTYSWT